LDLLRKPQAGAIWDFKVDILEYDPSIESVTLGGRQISYEAVANIHFGFAGRAAGIGGDILRMGAGAAQWAQWHDAHPDNVGPLAYQDNNGTHWAFFDEPFDAWCVVFGIYLYEQYGDTFDELTPEAFEQSMQDFIEIHGEPPSHD